MSIVSCSVDGCIEPVFVKKRGLCRRHYNRFMYAGTTDMVKVNPACLRCSETISRRNPFGPSPSYCSDSCQRAAGYERFLASGKYADRLDASRQERAARGLPQHSCVQCGGTFTSTHRRSKFCSSKCINKHTDLHNPVRCSEAGCDRGVRGKGLCSMHWRRKARAEGREANPVWDEGRKANYHKRRAQKLGTQVEDLRSIDIYERDIWLCGLCSTPVDPDANWPDPMSASLDHVTPLSKGGTHTYENVQLAHLTCNVSKGNRLAA